MEMLICDCACLGTRWFCLYEQADWNSMIYEPAKFGVISLAIIKISRHVYYLVINL